jgi:hypothetical protein
MSVTTASFHLLSAGPLQPAHPIDQLPHRAAWGFRQNVNPLIPKTWRPQEVRHNDVLNADPTEAAGNHGRRAAPPENDWRWSMAPVEVEWQVPGSSDQKSPSGRGGSNISEVLKARRFQIANEELLVSIASTDRIMLIYVDFGCCWFLVLGLLYMPS